MADREKLIELQKEVLLKLPFPWSTVWRDIATQIADHLIANGVTVQKHGRWEVVRGVFTPGGDPLLRCPICKSRESEHLCGIECRTDWDFCPTCGAKMDLPKGE